MQCFDNDCVVRHWILIKSGFPCLIHQQKEANHQEDQRRNSLGTGIAKYVQTFTKRGEKYRCDDEYKNLKHCLPVQWPLNGKILISSHFRETMQ